MGGVGHWLKENTYDGVGLCVCVCVCVCVCTVCVWRGGGGGGVHTAKSLQKGFFVQLFDFECCKFKSFKHFVSSVENMKTFWCILGLDLTKDQDGGIIKRMVKQGERVATPNDGATVTSESFFWFVCQSKQCQMFLVLPWAYMLFIISWKYKLVISMKQSFHETAAHLKCEAIPWCLRGQLFLGDLQRRWAVLHIMSCSAWCLCITLSPSLSLSLLSLFSLSLSLALCLCLSFSLSPFLSLSISLSLSLPPSLHLFLCVCVFVCVCGCVCVCVFVERERDRECVAHFLNSK